MPESQNAQHAPLNGVNLIEASAGTGKTYTLTSLYLRLLIEKQLFVEQILVVTFTVAATQELKDRIRQRLKTAREAYEGRPVDDPWVEELVKQNAPQGQLQVDDAIRRFDEAAIFTIHGFCQRILGENAFESGTSFDATLVTETQDFWLEVAQDFWRREFYQAPFTIIEHALKQKRTPVHYRKLLLNQAKYPDLAIVPQVDAPSLASIEQFESAKKRVVEDWPKNREKVIRAFSSGVLNAGQYGKPDSDKFKAMTYVEAMDSFTAGDSGGVGLFPQFQYFTREKVQKATKKKQTPPDLPFFQACEDLLEACSSAEEELEQYLLYLDNKAFGFARETVPARKAEQDIRFFDDLVAAFKSALAGDMGPALINAVQKKYAAALIDEFQDTDSAQYEIFKALFTGRNQVLFLIGDPKQAIYGFRGADLFSYLKASQKADNRFSLTHNWRSLPGLIHAVNTVFSQNPRAFVLEDIRFLPALPRPGLEQEELGPLLAGEAPMTVWLLPPTETGKAHAKGAVQDVAVRAVVSKISQLLQEGKYSPGEMAVLVRTNLQALAIQSGLLRAGIQSVLNRTGNLFDSPETMEVRRILVAVSHTRLQNIKAALSTNLMGWTAERLDQLVPGEEETERILDVFSRLHEIWQRFGFIRMFTTLLREQDVHATLLGLPEGERRLTNVLHLGEVLHQAEKEKKLGLSGLCQWLDRQLDASTPRSDEHQLRLESDAQAVQVVTMHGSKGLEYPVVFCPFLYQDSLPRKDEPITFHDAAANDRLTLDLRGENSPDKQQAMKETLAENVRLAYVALTRAREHCYTLWGAINKAETSAPAFLLHGQEGSLKTKLDPGKIGDDLEDLAQQSDNTIKIIPPPEEIYPFKPDNNLPGTPLDHKRFKGSIDGSWRVTSFSALSVNQPGKVEPGSDEALSPVIAPEEAPMDEEEFSIFTFPRGTGPGIFLHDIFENLDFTESNQDTVRKFIADKLDLYGYEDHWVEPILTMVNNTLGCPLLEGRPDFTLSTVSNAARANEMEFYFPIQKIAPASFAGLFGHGDMPDASRELYFSPVKGFVHGFIDLVFEFGGQYYLLDWKSNHLGYAVRDYSRESLAHAMAHHKYDLQYMLYTMALDLHLGQRIPDYDYDRDFGGVFYLFLRGMDKEQGPQFGVFHDRPDAGTINQLKSQLL